MQKPLETFAGRACLALACGLAASWSAHAQTVAVSAQCNLYGAGHATPLTSCSTSIGPGILPVLVHVPPNAVAVEFHDVTGTILYCPTCTPANGPEGGPAPGVLPALGGISAINIPRSRAFHGVFLTDSEPTDPAPPAIIYPSVDFAESFPQVAQVFFIGDGLVGLGSGAIQRFAVPPSATRLFLGFSDGFAGCIGAYGDNAGSIAATIAFRTCAEVAGCCTPDFNRDGDLNPDDLSDYIACYFAAPPCVQADFNADGFADPDDLSDYIAAYFGGC